ncbi:hypothetical protein D6D57_14975 [Listeria monocytogenes]|nr:hypothetical protein [Listeria monocytogenes]
MAISTKGLLQELIDDEFLLYKRENTSAKYLYEGSDKLWFVGRCVSFNNLNSCLIWFIIKMK